MASIATGGVLLRRLGTRRRVPFGGAAITDGVGGAMRRRGGFGRSRTSDPEHGVCRCLCLTRCFWVAATMLLAVRVLQSGEGFLLLLLLLVHS